MKTDEYLKLSANDRAFPYSQDLSALSEPCSFAGITLKNRLIVHPIETFYNAPDGSPTDTTYRQYRRFADSGASLVWFEAVAVQEDGRSTSRQLWLREDNLDAFKRLVDEMKKISGGVPIIAQLTHSGRFSKPHDRPEPIIAYHNPVMNRVFDISPSVPTVSDDYLDRLRESYVKSAILAAKVGFDGVDVKACHRYLMSELLSAYERGGKYGGSFENRTRLLRETVRAVRSALPSSVFIGSRLNLYDGFVYPYGFGVEKGGNLEVDMTEPLQLAGELYGDGVSIINVSMGTPYVNPHVNRPYNRGGYVPPEPPTKGVKRLISGAAALKKAYPAIMVVGTGYSYLGQAAPFAAAGAVKDGLCDLVGFGRMAIAYPNFASDMLAGRFDGKKACVACGKCTMISRAGGPAGCPVRDTEMFLPLYRKLVEKK